MAYVIGVAAQAQMGKDTLADRLQEKLNKKLGQEVWTRTAFAGNVKRVFEETFGVDRDFTEEWKVKLGENPPGFDMPVRNALQFIGDGFRGIRSTIWLDLCFRDDVPKIISDVRYVNEFVRVKNEGGLNILIGRPDKINDDPNGSEAQIKPYVEYALEHFKDHLTGANKRFFDLTRGFARRMDRPGPPKDMEMFDVFIRNDGTKEEFYEIIDTQLVDFVTNFVFDFPTDKKEEKECLISN